ncbi:DUF2169 domain-containing protein [Sodalis sp. RH14]|uniref:DUF2169 family type VI secretion system accessory protein n=1 Tax=Sodalis sp. RH14 TaxID=3394329 RepID=UPI0039B640E7
MNIIKPLRLGVLHRPWRWLGQNQLGVSVLALADMGPAPRLRPEPELWQLAARELAGDGGLLDLAIPKACAEFLATGYAYTRHQRQNNACMVKIQVDALEKSLMVFGERFWVSGRPTEALPFARLRLDWQNAFGGENDTRNPRGLGAHPVERNGVICHPLAHIEPEAGYGASRRRIKPDCFGPLDFCLPEQFSRIGKSYDRRWLEQEYPGFARDIDWHVFNRAGRDQWWPRSPSLPLGAPWRIWNMHPEQPLQQGVLPDWRARCFITRAAVPDDHHACAPPALEEITLRATTLWFFPHVEQMVLIWQGSCGIQEDDALDVDNMLVALEAARESRPLAHYRDVLQARSRKATAAAHALCEQDLVTESLIGPWLDTAPRPPESPLAANLARREADLREKRGQPLPDSGVHTTLPGQATPADRSPGRHQGAADARISLRDGDTGAGDGNTDAGDSAGNLVARAQEPGPLPGELPRYMARVERQAAALQQRALEKAAALGADMTDAVDGAGPAHYHRMLAALRREAEDSAGAGPSIDTPEARLALHQMYRLAAAARPAAPQAAAECRPRLQALLAQTRDLGDMDLTGADLRGLDLRGVNLQRALLESARLDNCLLDGADLSDAMLAHASLTGASLRDARLAEACLTGARCHNTLFSGAQLSGTTVTRAAFADCCFDRAQLSGLLFYHTAIHRCRFSHAALTNCTFLDADATAPDFSHCRLEKVTFNQGRLDAACFNAARLSGCSFITLALDEIRFQEAALDSCVFTGGTHAGGAAFRRARLTSCNFRQTPLDRADFSQVEAQSCDFSGAVLTRARLDGINAGGCLFIRADLSHASLTRADLIGALLQKSRLAGADLRAANLFRADLSLATIDRHTRLQGAYTHQCKTLPRAQEPSS